MTSTSQKSQEQFHGTSYIASCIQKTTWRKEINISKKVLLLKRDTNLEGEQYHT